VTEPDATQRLRNDLAAHPETKHLAECLTEIETAVARTWQSNAMPWFTDHGPAHSRRVARYANQLAACPYILERDRLTGIERFVLYAASWLHDIGMQDLTGAGALGGPHVDYARVRHEHPDRTAALLLRDYAEFGLPDDPVLAQTVAEVARAHGTRTYRPAVDRMRRRSMIVCGRPVRGPLLACLLLMADELDLRHDRVNPFTGRGQIGSVSAAHAFKHQCVQGSELEFSDERRTIGVRLDLAFPAELPDADGDDIERWIVLKLRRQMAMVERELLDGLGLSFDRRIQVRTERVEARWARPDQDALAVIRADNARDTLIDHGEILATATTLADRPGMLVLRGEWRDDIDLDGREDILVALAAAARAGGRKVLVSERARDGKMASAGDVVGEWLDRALGRPADTVPQRQAEPVEELTQLLEAVGAGTPPWLLLLPCADLMDEVDRKWLFEVAVPRLVAAGDVTVVVTAGRATWIPDEPTVSRLDTHDLDRDAVRLHLMRYAGGVGGRDTAEALTRVRDETRARPYVEFKKMVEEFEESFTLDDDGRVQGERP
jgi:hypothetical protein